MAKITRNLFNEVALYIVAIFFIPLVLWLIVALTELIYKFILTLIASSNSKESSPSFVNESTVFWFLITLLALSVFIIYKVPKIQIQYLKLQEDISPKLRFERKKDRIKLEDEIRKTLTQIIGGCFVIATIYFTYISYDQSRKTKNSEQVSKALEALKENSISTAGVFLLEKVALNSPEDANTIVKVLCSHLQEKSGVGKERTLSSNTIRTTISTIIKLNLKVVDRIDLSNIDFRDLDLVFNNSFPKNVDLSNSNLSGVKLNDVDFSEAKLNGAIFNSVDFSRVELGSAINNLSGADLRKVRLYSYQQSPGQSKVISSSICEDDQRLRQYPDSYTNCDLKDLKEANLSNSNLTGNNTLASSNLYKVNFTNAILTGTILTNANLTNANLTNANLTNADLTNADLTNADLTNADLTNVKLFNVDLSKSKGLIIEKLQDALIDDKTILPESFKYKEKELIKKTQEYFENQRKEREQNKLFLSPKN